jgi:hypothetical protein
MSTAPLLLLATTANAAMLLGSWAVSHHSARGRDPQVIRAQLIELVDANGTVRGQLHLGEDGSGQLRLRDGRGRVAVKLGGRRAGGGALLLMDPSVEPAVVLTAGEPSPSITLRGDGRSKVLEP